MGAPSHQGHGAHLVTAPAPLTIGQRIEACGVVGEVRTAQTMGGGRTGRRQRIIVREETTGDLHTMLVDIGGAVDGPEPEYDVSQPIGLAAAEGLARRVIAGIDTRLPVNRINDVLAMAVVAFADLWREATTPPPRRGKHAPDPGVPPATIDHAIPNPAIPNPERLAISGAVTNPKR